MTYYIKKRGDEIPFDTIAEARQYAIHSKVNHIRDRKVAKEKRRVYILKDGVVGFVESDINAPYGYVWYSGTTFYLLKKDGSIIRTKSVYSEYVQKRKLNYGY